MMRICVHRNVIIMLLASSALFARGDDFLVKAQSHSTVPDVHQIVELSIAATQRHWQVRLHSTYVEREEDRRMDTAGRVKSEEVECFETSSSMAWRSSNSWNATGDLPRPTEERKQKAQLDKLKRETPEQLADRLRKQKECQPHRGFLYQVK